MKIGIISDTHSYMDDRIKHHLSQCDEIWHGGDFGDYKVIEELKAIAPLKGVYGNIDDKNVRAEFPEELLFDCEGMKVYIRHISGYPGRYNPKAKRRINELRPDLVIVGHSHICKVIRDPYFNHIHINPGAAGVHGFHKMRTLALAEIEKGKITDLKVMELGKRGKL
jgi:putative phosphoesterase